MNAVEPMTAPDTLPRPDAAVSDPAARPSLPLA